MLKTWSHTGGSWRVHPIVCVFSCLFNQSPWCWKLKVTLGIAKVFIHSVVFSCLFSNFWYIFVPLKMYGGQLAFFDTEKMVSFRNICIYFFIKSTSQVIIVCVFQAKWEAIISKYFGILLPNLIESCYFRGVKSQEIC